MLCVRQRRLFRIVPMTDTRDELAMFQERVNLREALDLARRDSFEDVHGPKMARVSQSSRSHQLAQGGERAAVKLAHASGLVVDHERPLAPRILGRDAGWAAVGMTGLRLDAAQRKHVGLTAVAAAHRDTKVVTFDRTRNDRMIDPLEVVAVDVL